ncbi:uncharacterized protein GLRG_02606 [Colletotrichum graminicola M1.001]|uniref:Uncharacterized protein n=1 Tax=Colletotrichum graminicola (strain M1.001 / M2 / FGSC 10212) TaxID=645133 RepID=E3Q7E8_COLGM|nr:uncharacterized protein GLRG_02606 [Colletotrichum graminicola M1.001]EFQ26786.1 hypothetical protein GLRG_02606 [Colletotrichum graminicola M1.001]
MGRGGFVLPPPAIEEPDDVVDDDGDDERGDWESVRSASGIPSRMQGGGGGGAVMSAARISLGNRLKKSAGDTAAAWTRASNLGRTRGGRGAVTNASGSTRGSWRSGR